MIRIEICVKTAWMAERIELEKRAIFDLKLEFLRKRI